MEEPIKFPVDRVKKLQIYLKEDCDNLGEVNQDYKQLKSLKD